MIYMYREHVSHHFWKGFRL